MIIKSHFKFFLAALCGILIASSLVNAQGAPADSSVLSGEIILERDAARADSYESQQEAGLAFLRTVNASIASGATNTIASPSDSALSYLNVAYLYCSITEGTCPAILDAVLEADIINSRANRVTACPIMTRFWRLYLKSDMEQRHSHYVKTGFLTVTDEFKKRQRPAYIRCKETVDTALNSGQSRYGSDSPVRRNIERSVRLVEDMKARVPNLFTALGAR